MAPLLRLAVLRALGLRATVPILPITRFSIIPRPTLSSQLRLAHTSRPPLNQTRPTQSSTPPPPTPTPTKEELDQRKRLPEGATLSQKLKHLIKAYGWYALGVYIAFSVLDFGVAFAAINVIGADHVGRVTANVKASVTETLKSIGVIDVLHSVGILHAASGEVDEAASDSLSEKGGSEGLYAMLVLAYTVHKTLFLPVRVGLTAGLTPKLVNWLMKRGWTGRAGATRAATEMRQNINDRRGAASKRMKGARDMMQQKIKNRKDKRRD